MLMSMKTLLTQLLSVLTVCSYIHSVIGTQYDLYSCIMKINFCGQFVVNEWLISW